MQDFGAACGHWFSIHTILNHLEKSVKEEQITTLSKYNLLFPFKNFTHQITTSFSCLLGLT